MADRGAVAAHPRRGTRPTGNRVLGAFALLALFLAACTQPPPPPPPADPLTATADGGNTAAATVDLAPGEWVDYRLVLGAVRDAFDVVYAELGSAQPAVVELRSGAYWGVIASSQTPDYFVPGTIAGVPQPTPGASSAEAQPSAITTNVVCRGPCVIFDPGSANHYLRVVNTGGSRLVADLYLYGAALADAHEPANDSRSGAPALADGETGALELLGDVDYWTAQSDADVEVVPHANGLAVEVSVYDSCGLAVAGPYPGDQPFRVYAGESIRVRAAQNRAGPSGRSGYTLLAGSPSGGVPGRDPGCVSVNAGTNPDSPVGSVFLGSGGAATFVVSVPSSVRARDVIQFEMGGSGTLEVLASAGGSTLYSSSSPDVFYAGAAGAAAGADLAPAAVAVSRACGGPCVIDPSPASSYVVRVRNGGGARSVPLYAFGRAFDDTTEPANDSPGTAPTVTDDGSGAIEYVGDEDLWYVPSRRFVTFDAVAGLPLEAHVLNAAGFVVDGPFLPGGAAFEVFGNEYVRVRASDGDAAAVAGRSTYFLQ